MPYYFCAMRKIDIEKQITINATVEQVWHVFSDFKAYTEWSPTILFLSAAPQQGESTTVLLQQPDGKKMTMHPKVLRLVEMKELRWRGRLLLPGLFDGEHYFILKPLPNGTTLFIQGEHFDGLLVPLLRKMILGPTQRGFEAFNQALKRKVEEQVTMSL